MRGAPGDASVQRHVATICPAGPPPCGRRGDAPIPRRNAMKPKQELGALLIAVLAMMMACGGESNRENPLASRATRLGVEQEGCVYADWSAPVNMGRDV